MYTFDNVSFSFEDTFQTFGKEVCLTDHLAPTQMCPVYSTAHDEPVCCACQIKFGGCLPGSRAEAVLPYWVPLSLRPQKQVGGSKQRIFTWVQGALPGTSHPSES